MHSAVQYEHAAHEHTNQPTNTRTANVMEFYSFEIVHFPGIAQCLPIVFILDFIYNKRALYLASSSSIHTYRYFYTFLSVILIGLYIWSHASNNYSRIVYTTHVFRIIIH